MKPSDHYLHLAHQKLITLDPQQLSALFILDNVYTQLISELEKRQSLLGKLRPAKQITGVYLWGGVGIGKTYIMDCFFKALPLPAKLRLHFHAFMKKIHQELKKHQGEKNPLDKIIKNLSSQTMVLCLDEFHVNDIVDAMLLATVLQGLQAHRISLVATSNVPPDELYKNGLQRPLFIPAIKLLKDITTVTHLPTNIDYRTQHLNHAGAFYTPDDAIAEENMEKSFYLLSDQAPHHQGIIEINQRPIRILKQAGDIIWFNFKDICSVPRSQLDYLTLSEQYKTIFISHIPRIESNDKNTLHLFIRMIDVFYDAKLRLVCSLEVDLDELYLGEHMKFEFERTLSRLREMQSEQYFCH